MPKFTINSSLPHKNIFKTIQMQDSVKSKRNVYETEFYSNRAKIKKPQKSTIICLQEKKELYKVLILPLMDIKHYNEILIQTQINSNQEMLQFNTQYTPQMPTSNHKKYFRKSFCSNNKQPNIDQAYINFSVTRSTDLKKQPNTHKQTFQTGIKSPQIIELQTCQKPKSLISPVKHKKVSILSQIQTTKRKGKASALQHMLLRYQNVQLQSDKSGWEWMSRWLIGRRLINHKKHF